MPRTMLNDQHWSKLKSILRNFNIYLKPNLRNFIEAILLESEQVVLGELYLKNLVSQTLSLRNTIVGLKMISL